MSFAKHVPEKISLWNRSNCHKSWNNKFKLCLKLTNVRSFLNHRESSDLLGSYSKIFEILEVNFDSLRSFVSFITT